MRPNCWNQGIIRSVVIAGAALALALEALAQPVIGKVEKQAAENAPQKPVVKIVEKGGKPGKSATPKTEQVITPEMKSAMTRVLNACPGEIGLFCNSFKTDPGAVACLLKHRDDVNKVCSTAIDAGLPLLGGKPR